MGRGRPKHPDILTPREWQVLALLRDGKSNKEIAQQLGISFDGVRYHVAEILSKLGVSSRREAAAWQPESIERRPVLLPFLGRLLRMLIRVRTAVTVALGGAAVLLALLAIGVFAMNQRLSSSAADTTASPIVEPTAVGNAIAPPQPTAASVFTSRDDIAPRQHSLFFDKDGFITVTEYDDRNLSAEEKRLDPRPNPRWEPFAACVAASDLEVRDDPARAYTQDDLDRLVALVNQEGPFEEATPRGLVYQGTAASDAFLTCAEAYLR